MIIDSHVHIYPDKIASKAAKSIENFYDIPVDNNGTVTRLIEANTEAGVNVSLIHSVATTSEQVESINNFIISQVNEHKGSFVGFCTLHPDYANPGKEIDRILAAGLKGIKLHSDFQKFNIDDERVFPIYEAAEGRLPILFHMGDKRYEYSKPRRLYNIIQKFPKLQIIGAHFSGYSEWDDAAEILRGTGIWVDTSSSLEFISPEKARHLIDVYGSDRVMFASDYPMWSPADELKKLARIPMTDDERERILYKNAASLLGIETH